METFVENLTRNAVATASANEETNVYALALDTYNTLSETQKRAFEIAFKAYQRKWFCSISYQVQKDTSKEFRKTIPSVTKYSKIVTHFENYEKLVRKENETFVAEQRKWGTRINEVCVYHKGKIYLSMKPTYTAKALYSIMTEQGEQFISYEQEQSMLAPSKRDAYLREKTEQRQGTTEIVRCADICIDNVSSIKCGATEQVNEMELDLI